MLYVYRVILYLYGTQNYLIQEDDQVDRIHETDRQAIKNLIVNLMLTSPESIQKQLSDAISIIGKTDFPLKWPELITQMVEKFATGIIFGTVLFLHYNNNKYFR